MVNYTYNAWGVVSSSVNSSLSGDLLAAANGLLVHNPYVYKGYYYDSDTGYYYLKSRYYDPRIHRFLSADKIDYLDPKSLSSLNLYVYCGDNPVMGYDPSGKWDLGKLGVILLAVITLIGYLAVAVASLWNKTIKAEMDAIHWNPFNTDASLAANADIVSFYRGQLVIHTDIFGGTFSAGIMVVDSTWNGDANTIKHEWGHFAQLLILGPVAYGVFVALPSVVYNRFFDSTNKQYYSKIWERTADWLGGAKSSDEYYPFWNWRNFVPW